MSLGRRARRGVIELARIGFRQRYEFRQRLGRHLGVDQKQQRILGHHHDRREIALGIIGHLLMGGRNDGEARGNHQQRVAVRGGLGGGVGADDAARGRPVVDDERLPQRPLQIRCHQPCHHVVEAAGRERDDETNRTAGIGIGLLRAGDVDRYHHRQCGQPESELTPTPLNHCTSPDRPHGPPRGHAANLSISAMTASPISDVVTILAPSDLMSAVRNPFSSVAAIARSIRSASLPMSKE